MFWAVRESERKGGKRKKKKEKECFVALFMTVAWSPEMSSSQG